MTQQAPGFYRRRIGDLLVTAINDGFIDIGPEKLVNIDPAEAEARLQAAIHSRISRSSVNTFLIQGSIGGKDRTILIDTGAGDGMGPTMGRLLANLGAAGVQPGDVDMVIMTHLHPDHSGNLATAGGTAVFPHAELAIPEPEAAFWLSEATLARAPDGMKPYVLGAQSAAAPYRARMTMSETPAPVITRMPLHGHTPGHSGYVIDGGSQSLLIWGDVMHMPALQAADPSICVVYDIDAAAAEASRRTALDMAAADDMLVAGMHLNFPAFHHVVRDGAGYRLIAEPWAAEV